MSETPSERLRAATDLANDIGRIEGEMLSNASCAALAAALDAARAEERERCAKVAELQSEAWRAWQPHPDDGEVEGRRHAAAIRCDESKCIAAAIRAGAGR